MMWSQQSSATRIRDRVQDLPRTRTQDGLCGKGSERLRCDKVSDTQTALVQLSGNTDFYDNSSETSHVYGTILAKVSPVVDPPIFWGRLISKILGAVRVIPRDHGHLTQPKTRKRGMQKMGWYCAHMFLSTGTKVDCIVECTWPADTFDEAACSSKSASTRLRTSKPRPGVCCSSVASRRIPTKLRHCSWEFRYVRRNSVGGIVSAWRRMALQSCSTYPRLPAL